MRNPLRFLVAENDAPEARNSRREKSGRTMGETYVAALRSISPDAVCDRVRPGDGERAQTDAVGSYDAVFLTGSTLHLYDETAAVRRELEFVRTVFSSGTPCFGSCAGLQLAAVAAGGTVRANQAGRVAGFARRIAVTSPGLSHPLLAGRPPVFDAPSFHSDEVASLPEGATVLASSPTTEVQAAEIRLNGGIFWGVQYHPELPLSEVASALERQTDELVEEGFAEEEIAAQAALIDALDRQPDRRDLAWRLGVDEEVTDGIRRTTELRNFIERLVQPTRSARGRE